MTQAATMMRISPKEMGTTLELKEDQLYFKESRWPWEDFQWPILRWWQGWLCFPICSPFPSSIHPWNSSLKALAHWCAGGIWSLDMSLPSFPVPVSWIKQPFFSINTYLLNIRLWAVSSWSWVLIISWSFLRYIHKSVWTELYVLATVITYILNSSYALGKLLGARL